MHPTLHLMKNKICLFILLCFTPNYLFAQNVKIKLVEKNTFTNSQKKHSAIDTLVWQDFRTKLEENMSYEALTVTNLYSGYAVSTRGNNTNVTFTVQMFFDKNKSSVKTKNQNPYILNHEQVHFDIAYYHYCLMWQALKNTQWNTKNYIQQFKNIVATARENSKAMQDQYDAETNHSINKTEQEAWNVKVKGFLLEVEHYNK